MWLSQLFSTFEQKSDFVVPFAWELGGKMRKKAPKLRIISCSCASKIFVRQISAPEEEIFRVAEAFDLGCFPPPCVKSAAGPAACNVLAPAAPVFQSLLCLWRAPTLHSFFPFTLSPRRINTMAVVNLISGK